MADNLIFTIKFDLDKAVEQAGKDWDGKFADKLEKLIAKRPVNVKLKLDTKNLDSLDAVKKRLAELKIEPITPETKSAIKELTSELRQLAKALETLQKYSKNPTKGAVDTSKVQLNEARAQVQAALAAQRTAKAEDNLAAARLKAARAANVHATATRNASKAYSEQNTYLQRLIQRMAAYWSIRQVGNFLTYVREVTAQFELQRVSLGAIIQDQQRANQLFEEIKSFALTSPLKILDLTKYTKQVAAYGFETEKLFDTTKMLADISVGLGSDMSRATLFLGQVFATGYLRAAELRQATELGIPLVDKLAKKLEELNGRFYSAADVMDLISKRAISFEMVESVFKDMTSAGGEFYNMQVKQSQTLFGMWSKLGDAAAVMYDQIGNTEEINAGMKATISSLEQMMRNWKTTARVLDSVATGIIVYVAGLKNAAIASKALTIAEAARLAVTNSQVIATPKLVAAIIGQNAATRLSATLTRAHTVAMINQSVATNVLTRSFWGLTAALLANPWIAATAAIAGITAAIIHFTGNVETAAERAEKLNNSVASLKNLDDTTKPLVDTYNELINKTERTVEEQKKLSEVTHELAKQYPGAITAVGNFGAEVELAADKLNQLYQAEKQARMDNTRYELGETEKKIKEVEAEIEKYQQQLASGEKTIYKRLGDSGLYTKKIVPLTEEDKGDILKQIDELRVGTDGQSGLLGLQQSAEAARRALGLVPSEAAQAVEKFGAWKKTLTTFRQQVGNVRVQLFDDSTINQFGSLEEALKKTAEEYKKNIALVETYDKVLESSVISSEERAKIETEKAEADTMATLAKNALKYYNALSLLDDKKSDPRLGILKEMVSTLKQVNKEYDDLAKKEGNTKALADTQKIYADTFKNMQALAKQYKFALPDFGVPTDTASLTKYLEAIKMSMEKLPKSQKAVLALQVDIDKLDIDDKQKQIEEELKRLSDRVSRTKTAKEFYNKILSTTGDLDLAASVTMSIYGDTGEGLFGSIAKQIRDTFKSGDVSVDLEIGAAIDSAIDVDNERINYGELAKIYDKYQDKIIEKNRSTAENIVKEGQKTAASNIDTWEKELAKAKDYDEQRTDIIKRETQRRAEIIKSYDYTPEQKEEKLKLSRKRQEEGLAKVNFEEFTKSEDYIRIFENLDNVATSSLKRLREEMQSLIDTNHDLSPENMKTLVKAMENIDEQIGERNPFETLVSSAKEYIESIKNIKIAKQELVAAEAEYKTQEPQLTADVNTAKAQKETADANVVLAERNLFEIRQQMAELRAQEIVDETILTSFREQEIAAENRLVSAKRQQNQAEANIVMAIQKQTNAQNKVNKAQNKVNKATDNAKKSQNKFLKSTNNVKEKVGAVQTAMQALSPILGDLTKEGTAFGDAWATVTMMIETFQSLMSVVITLQEAFNVVTASNPWLAIAAAVLAVISALSFGIGAAKVRRANREIEKQKDLLRQLQRNYDILEEKLDTVFGSEYLVNYDKMLKNLAAQQEAYLKQAEAERSKGKKEDEDKTQQFEDNAYDTAKKIKDLQDDLVAQMVGTDIGSAAKEFADAWLDAYLTFGDTAGAIEEKFNEMMKSFVVHQALAGVVQRVLQPFFDQIDQAAADKELSSQELANIMSTLPGYISMIDDGLSVSMEALRQAGFDLESLRDTTSGFTGISRDIASASEESINGLAAGINTQNFYISQIHTNVALIAQSMLNGGTVKPTGGISVQELITLQNTYLSTLPAIEANTAATVVRCERAALACENMSNQLSKVIRPIGTKAVYSVSTTLN